MICALAIKVTAMCALDYCYVWCRRTAQNGPVEVWPRMVPRGDGQPNAAAIQAVPTLMVVD